MPDRLDYYFYMSEKNPAAVELGRRGGLKGGKARAAKMTPEESSSRHVRRLRRGGLRSDNRNLRS
jgi:hypothetical protein